MLTAAVMNQLGERAEEELSREDVWKADLALAPGGTSRGLRLDDVPSSTSLSLPHSPQGLQGLLVLPPLLLVNGVQLKEQQAYEDEDYGSHGHQHLQCELDTCWLGAATGLVPSKAVGPSG